MTLQPGWVAITADELAVLIKALTIGRISWDGDGWFAEDAGYDYDDAERTLDDASRVIHRLAEWARR